MSPSSMYHWSAKPPCLLQRMPRVMSTGELRWTTKLEVRRFLQSDRVVCLQSLFLCRVIHAESMGGCLPLAVRSDASSRLCCHHAQGQAALQGAINAAPRSFGNGESPSCSSKDKFRRFHVAAAVCFGRNRDSSMSEPVIHSSKRS